MQARNATLDIEVTNIKSLINNLKSLRDNWTSILSECKLVAQELNISPEFPETRRKTRKKFADETPSETPNEIVVPNAENDFKRDVFYTMLDCVLGNVTRRYEAANEIDDLFNFLWQYNYIR